MRILTDHRSTTKWATAATYRAAADEFVAACLNLDLMDAVIICGSLVKNDIVSGWSDLDIVCIARDDAAKEKTIVELGEIVKRLSRTAAIGIGIDLVWRAEFDYTSRIGGKPLAMTYEVAQYGEFYFHRAPLSTASPLCMVRNQLQDERAALMLSELHNWRRMNFSEKNAEDNILAVKTVLKLLKICVAPYIGTDYTHADDLTRLNDSTPALSRKLFGMAVDARAVWGMNRNADRERSLIIRNLLAEIDVLELIRTSNAVSASRL